MRNLKKLLNGELLQLALFLSLLRVDPESFLQSGTQSSNNALNDLDFLNDHGQLWTRYEDRPYLFGRGNFGSDLSPRLHPKSMDHMLERFQSEILEDLNSLGQYSRIRSYGGDPVEISAYVLNTDMPLLGNSTAAEEMTTVRPCTLTSDSDSGISDTENNPTFQDSALLDECQSDSELSAIDPRTLELPKVDTLGEDSDGFVDPDFLADQIVEIDDQLMTIGDQLDEITDEFLQLDEQLAVHISDNEVKEVEETEENDEDMETEEGPFDSWETDMNRDFSELLSIENCNELQDEAVSGYQPCNDLISSPSFPRRQSSSSVASSPQSLESRSRNPSDLQPPEKHQGTGGGGGSLLLDYANLQMNLYGENQSFTRSSSEQQQIQPLFSPFSNSDGAPGEEVYSEFLEQSRNTTSSSSQVIPSAIGSLDFLGQHNSSQSSFHSSPNVLRSSDPDLLHFPGSNDTQRHHSAPSVRTTFDRSEPGDQHPEFIHYPSTNDSAISGPLISPHDGCPYPNGSLYAFSPGATGLPPYPSLNHSYAAPQGGDTPSSFIKQEEEDHRHLSGVHLGQNNTININNNSHELKRSLDQGFHKSCSSSSLIKSERDPYSSSSSSSSSSTSSSMNVGGATSSSFSNRSRHSKDEQRARKLGVPFSVDDIVGLPMDEYNDMIARHSLSDEQLSLCRDIRRRGKNKVAAQNCRKRKINQISELKTTIELNREIQNRLMEQRSHLIRMRQEYTELVLDAERQYWSKSKYDPELFEFRFSDDGSSVAVVPKISTSTGEDVSDTTNYRH